MKMSLDKKKIRKREGPPVIFNYSGHSMNPTFKAGDGLMVLPYGRRNARPGDVIVFCSPESGRNVVHRVVRVDSKGIMTRGDNSILEDPWVLNPRTLSVVWYLQSEHAGI